jgi:O-antigen/teichoic acid export membrane protein
LKAIRQLGLVMFPAAAFLAAVAPVIIVPILGSKWAQFRDSFVVLSLLAVYAGNRTMLSVFFEAYKSIGKPWLVWAYNTVKLAVMVPAMIYGAHFGIVGLALTYIPIQILEIPLGLWLAQKQLAVSPLAVWRAASVPILSTLLMTAAVIGIEVLMVGVLQLGDLPALLACCVVGAVGYLGAIFLLDRRILLEARAVLVRGL